MGKNTPDSAALAEAATTGGLPPFPECAWRGLFADYRAAMDGTTEASDVAHFATFWTAVATTLGREIHMWSGDTIYPNVYILFYGPTGDKKTTAQRRLLSCQLFEFAPNIPVIQNAGSTEGLADRMMSTGGGPYLFLWEEFASFLSVARWSASTLLQFLVETYDCPPEWKRDFRNKPIELAKPTPSIFTCSTPEWFWQYAKPDDFFGGFGNRFVYLSGPKKDPISDPTQIDGQKIHCIKNRLRELTEALGQNQIRRGRWTPDAQTRWDKFYRATANRNQKGILGAALRRLHVHTRKLALTYAFLEDTFPDITDDQLRAAIAVIAYSTHSVKQLMEMQSQTAESESRRELEARILDSINKHGDPGIRLRTLQQSLCKLKGDSEFFHRVLRSLMQTDQVELRKIGKKTFVFRTG